jgi:Secretion system C-terminal sorting domain
MMKNIFKLLFFLLNAHALLAQNNAIFNGGSGDGWNKTAFAQPINNIFKGGDGDGWDKAAFAQPINNIFKGGDGDGWDKAAFAQPINNIFKGGDGDGWDKAAFAQPINNIFKGGDGDGWSKDTFAQLGNKIYGGGQGDGWASTYRPMGALPITFVYFDAKKDKTTSLLSWVTSSEINSLQFDVERSNNAVFFTKIGSVKATGNSTNAISYDFVDKNPTSGINYYRLKQIDRDGKFIYTPTRSVLFDASDNNKFKYYPNPTSGMLTIELPNLSSNEMKVINIINAAGATVNQLKIRDNINNTIELDLSNYSKGIYFIQLITPTFNSTEKVIVH